MLMFLMQGRNVVEVNLNEKLTEEYGMCDYCFCKKYITAKGYVNKNFSKLKSKLDGNVFTISDLSDILDVNLSVLPHDKFFNVIKEKLNFVDMRCIDIDVQRGIVVFEPIHNYDYILESNDDIKSDDFFVRWGDYIFCSFECFEEFIRKRYGEEYYFKPDFDWNENSKNKYICGSIKSKKDSKFDLFFWTQFYSPVMLDKRFELYKSRRI